MAHRLRKPQQRATSLACPERRNAERPERRRRGPDAVGSGLRGATRAVPRGFHRCSEPRRPAARVTSCDASVVAGVRHGGSENRVSFLRRTSRREQATATAPWAAVRAETMSPGGAGRSGGLLLAVGWLLLAGLQSACGKNVTAIQDPSLGHGEEESENDSENENESESEEVDEESHELDGEMLPQPLSEEDGEVGRLLVRHEGTF